MSQTRSELVALNADVVGFSRLIADDLDATTASMDASRDLVQRIVTGNEGTLVNFVGDNFMAVFNDATDAMKAAISITTEIEALKRDRDAARRVRFRMGLDQGQVTVSGGQYFGDALNVAARIQAIAPPGGISVSGRVYRALDEPALRFDPIGRRHLKNIPEEADIYQFADLPADGSTPTDQRSLGLDAPIVAVLPIHTEAVDDAVRATAGILRMDLIHRLARVPQLKVIDASAEPAPRGTGATARYMIETGVLQAGTDIRVYAKVVDVISMNIVKALKWTSKAADLLELSGALVDEVARVLEVELVIGEPAGIYAELDDPQAIEQVYLGWYHLTAGTPEGWTRALEHFENVAQAQPDKAQGHVLVAFTQWVGVSNGWAQDRDETLRTARQKAQIGSAAGDRTGLGSMVEAAVLMSLGQGPEALKMIESAEIQRPTCDVTFALEGSVRRYLGDWDEAVDLTDRAMRLTAVNKPWYPTVKACSLFLGGRLEQAAATAEMVLAYQPHNLEALLVLTAAQMELGLERRARATAELVRERYPSADIAAWLESNPYQSRDVVDRWRADLVSAGAIPSRDADPHAVARSEVRPA